ncbi:MAG: hypothetical protein ACXVH2_06205 [Methanobacterium sp.]
MKEALFVEIVYITEGGSLLKVGQDSVTDIKIEDNGVTIYFMDEDRKWVRFIPFTSILHYETNII